jgi:hypothetical protein
MIAKQLEHFNQNSETSLLLRKMTTNLKEFRGHPI